MATGPRRSAPQDFKLGHLELTPELNFQKRLGYSHENGGIAKDRIYGGLKMVLPFGIL